MKHEKEDRADIPSRVNHQPHDTNPMVGGANYDYDFSTGLNYSISAPGIAHEAAAKNTACSKQLLWHFHSMHTYTVTACLPLATNY